MASPFGIVILAVYFPCIAKLSTITEVGPAMGTNPKKTQNKSSQTAAAAVAAPAAHSTWSWTTSICLQCNGALVTCTVQVNLHGHSVF